MGFIVFQNPDEDLIFGFQECQNLKFMLSENGAPFGVEGRRCKREKRTSRWTMGIIIIVVAKNKSCL